MLANFQRATRATDNFPPCVRNLSLFIKNKESLCLETNGSWETFTSSPRRQRLVLSLSRLIFAVLLKKTPLETLRKVSPRFLVIAFKSKEQGGSEVEIRSLFGLLYPS
jgi:hypothetical protein